MASPRPGTPDDHATTFEPFVHLAGLTHDAALIAWGGFCFRDQDGDGDDWTIIEDPELVHLDGRERGSIGAAPEPFGQAVVELTALASGEVVAREATDEANHVWVRGLTPDTEYRYDFTVDGEPWAHGPRRDWIPDGAEGHDLERTQLTYDTRFRTFPAPDAAAPARFAVLGDYRG